MLVEHFGHVMGYWLVAGGLALIGVIASVAVSFKEREEEAAVQGVQEAGPDALVGHCPVRAR